MTAPMEPLAPPPEDRDWTFVIRDGCSECGWRPFEPTDAPARLQDAAIRWRRVLARPDVRERPQPLVWSPLEYSCHVRDVCRIMDERLRLMLTSDGARFANWDPDETAITDRYWEQDPAAVADEIDEAAAAAALTLSGVAGDDWRRAGLRSNGSEFTVATLAVYFLHDVEHHLDDVTG